MTPMLTRSPTLSALLWLSFSPSSQETVSTRLLVSSLYVTGTTTYKQQQTPAGARVQHGHISCQQNSIQRRSCKRGTCVTEAVTKYHTYKYTRSLSLALFMPMEVCSFILNNPLG